MIFASLQGGGWRRCDSIEDGQQRKAEDKNDAVPSMTDNNAALAQKAGAGYTVHSATLY